MKRKIFLVLLLIFSLLFNESGVLFKGYFLKTIEKIRADGSEVRAPASHAGGRRFKSCSAHHDFLFINN